MNNLISSLKSNSQEILRNPYVLGFLTLFAVSYAGSVVPQLKPESLRLLQSTQFRILAVFLIAYLSSHNFHLSLIVAVSFVLILKHITDKEIMENFNNF